jgi:hypothetical protein
MAVNGIALAALAGGSVFLYSALENQSFLSAIRDVISGKQPPVTTTAAASSGGGSGSGSGTAAAPAAPASVSGNMAIGKVLAALYGWSTGAQWNALVALWNRESGWDNTIWNGGSHAPTQPAGSSGAFGIPQALPYSKMPQAAWPTGDGGEASASAQISWGLSYIKSEYGTPEAAYNFDVANGGY